jgi:hypothetical protein
MVVIVPSNAKAKVIVPKKPGMSVISEPCLTSISSDERQEIYEVGSGTYKFLVK